MAFPTIPTAGAGRVLTTTTTGVGQTRTFPSLSSLTKNAGDLLIAIVVAYQSSTTNAQFGSWGASFTEFHDSGTSTTMAIGIAYKWSDGTETGTFTVTQSSSVTGTAAMILLSIPGAHASTPPEAGSRVSGTTSAANPGSFNPGGWDAEDTLWLAVGASGATSASGTYTGLGADPADFTDPVETGISADAGGGVEGGVSFRQLNAASIDVGTWTVDTSNARNAAVVVAIRPAPTAIEGTASSAFNVTVAATGKVTAKATATIGAVVDIVGSPHLIAKGQASSGVVVDLDGTPHLVAKGQADSDVVVDIVGTPKLTAKATGSSAAAVSVAATGHHIGVGQATSDISVDLTGTPHLIAKGQATSGVAVDIVGTPHLTARAQADSDVSVTLAATPLARPKGQATSGLIISVTADGEVVVPPPDYPIRAIFIGGKKVW